MNPGRSMALRNPAIRSITNTACAPILTTARPKGARPLATRDSPESSIRWSTFAATSAALGAVNGVAVPVLRVVCVGDGASPQGIESFPFPDARCGLRGPIVAARDHGRYMTDRVGHELAPAVLHGRSSGAGVADEIGLPALRGEHDRGYREHPDEDGRARAYEQGQPTSRRSAVTLHDFTTFRRDVTTEPTRPGRSRNTVRSAARRARTDQPAARSHVG